MPKIEKTIAKPQSKRTNLAPVMGVPKRPGVPMRPGMAKPPAKPAAAAPIAPVAEPSKPALARKPGRPGREMAVVTPEDVAALRAELAASKGEIVKLTNAANRARQNGEPTARTRAEIVDGIESLMIHVDEDTGEEIGDVAADDWRLAFQGVMCWIKGWDRKTDKGAERNEAFLTGEPSYRALLALPRASDGRWGNQARGRGELAIHSERDEHGRYVAEPLYINVKELALLQDESRNNWGWEDETE